MFFTTYISPLYCNETFNASPPPLPRNNRSSHTHAHTFTLHIYLSSFCLPWFLRMSLSMPIVELEAEDRVFVFHRQFHKGWPICQRERDLKSWPNAVCLVLITSVMKALYMGDGHSPCSSVWLGFFPRVSVETKPDIGALTQELFLPKYPTWMWNFVLDLGYCRKLKRQTQEGE